MAPFENCTTAVILPKNDTIKAHHFAKSPIYLVNHNCTNPAILERIRSPRRRRHPAKHCWASFSILPEDDDLPKYQPLDYVFSTQIFAHQYLILFTRYKFRVKNYLQHEFVHLLYRLEILIVGVSLYPNLELAHDSNVGSIRFEYHNTHLDPNIMTIDRQLSKPCI